MYRCCIEKVNADTKRILGRCEELSMARSKNYRDLLIKDLKDPEEAQNYFNAILEECKHCDEEEAQKLLLLALKNIADAQGGIAKLSAKTGLGRESLYKTLSSGGNPRLSTLLSITAVMCRCKWMENLRAKCARGSCSSSSTICTDNSD